MKQDGPSRGGKEQPEARARRSPRPSPARGRLWIVCSALVGLAWMGQAFWARWDQGRRASREYQPPPPGMVLVPAGAFLMGSNDPLSDPDERPLRRAHVEAFYMDRHEVSNRDYRKFKKDHTYPEGADDLPVSHVLKHEAEAYARFVGKRLPTAAEWEKAARGTDGRAFPWGHAFDPTKCNVRDSNRTNHLNKQLEAEACAADDALSARGKVAVDSFPEGASPYGVLNMCGNVWEWVSDVWEDRSWFGGEGAMSRGIIKGGGYGYSEKQCRASYQGFEGLETTCHDVGFRCAMDAIPRHP